MSKNPRKMESKNATPSPEPVAPVTHVCCTCVAELNGKITGQARIIAALEMEVTRRKGEAETRIIKPGLTWEGMNKGDGGPSER